MKVLRYHLWDMRDIILKNIREDCSALFGVVLEGPEVPLVGHEGGHHLVQGMYSVPR